MQQHNRQSGAFVDVMLPQASEQNRGANRHVPTKVSFDSIMDHPFWVFRN
jgi:hypothetical protein